MKKIILLLSVICITSVIVWGIFALPLITNASDTNKLAEQHFDKAIEHIRQLMYDDAIAELEKVIEMVPKSEIAQDAQYWIGQSYYKAGKYDDALSTFEKLTEEYPESAITPVTKLMVERVREAKENEEIRIKINDSSDKGVIIDPNTGVKYTKTKTFVGKRDVIDWTSYLELSPNGKFLLRHNLVLPLDSGDPFELVDMPALSGKWSPDGKKVVFTSGGAIWVVPVSPETGRPRGPAKKLLDGNYRFLIPIWSPDGEKLVFIREEDEVSGGIWTLSVKDGALTQITDDPISRLPIWSPDGKTIAYKTYKSGLFETMWMVPAEGGTPRKISIDKFRLLYFPRSPDGKWLFDTNPGPGGRNLHLIRLADEREFVITPPEGAGSFFFHPLSPDGKKMLLYRPSYDYRSVLKVVSASGGPTLELGRGLTLWPYEHFWSPDSKMIITEGLDREGNYGFWIIPLEGGEYFHIELDVTVPKPIPLCLSRDCENILFSDRKSDGTEDFWVVPISLKDTRTTGPAVMIFKGRQRGRGGMSSRSWSPDGSKIAISHEGDVWIANVKGGKPVQMTKTPEVEGWPRWSPDGKMVYYGKENILHIIPASGGKEIMRLEAHDDFAWSPDCKELAVAFKNGQLSVISMASGKTRRIADLKDMGLTRVNDLFWSPDGKNLAFIGYHIDEKGESYPIFIIPVEGGKATEIAADDQGWKYWFYWSPDSKWISYNSDGTVKTRPEGAIWEADVEELLEKLLD